MAQLDDPLSGRLVLDAGAVEVGLRLGDGPRHLPSTFSTCTWASTRRDFLNHSPSGLEVCVMAIMPCLGLLGLLADFVGLPAQSSTALSASSGERGTPSPSGSTGS